MLATLTDAAHFGDESGWAFEMKWDGVRAVCYLAGGRVKLLSRKGVTTPRPISTLSTTSPRSRSRR